MSHEGINPEQYDQQLDHIVDTRNVSYADAREILGKHPANSQTFDAVGEADSTGIPREVEEIPLSQEAGFVLHIIEATPYISYLKEPRAEIARMIIRHEITADEADILFGAIKKRKQELTARPEEN